jgi:hypothetical protein
METSTGEPSLEEPRMTEPTSAALKEEELRETRTP